MCLCVVGVGEEGEKDEKEERENEKRRDGRSLLTSENRD